MQVLDSTYEKGPGPAGTEHQRCQVVTTGRRGQSTRHLATGSSHTRLLLRHTTKAHVRTPGLRSQVFSAAAVVNRHPMRAAVPAPASAVSETGSTWNKLLADLPFLSLWFVCACPCVHTDTHIHLPHHLYEWYLLPGREPGVGTVSDSDTEPRLCPKHYTTAPSSLISHVKEGYALTHTEGV